MIYKYKCENGWVNGLSIIECSEPDYVYIDFKKIECIPEVPLNSDLNIIYEVEEFTSNPCIKLLKNRYANFYSTQPELAHLYYGKKRKFIRHFFSNLITLYSETGKCILKNDLKVFNKENFEKALKRI